ncbi:hypothetical protein SUDANB6_04048 [Streptomyces sp. enrichment culture]
MLFLQLAPLSFSFTLFISPAWRPTPALGRRRHPTRGKQIKGVGRGQWFTRLAPGAPWAVPPQNPNGRGGQGSTRAEPEYASSYSMPIPGSSSRPFENLDSISPGGSTRYCNPTVFSSGCAGSRSMTGICGLPREGGGRCRCGCCRTRPGRTPRVPDPRGARSPGAPRRRARTETVQAGNPPDDPAGVERVRCAASPAPGRARSGRPPPGVRARPPARRRGGAGPSAREAGEEAGPGGDGAAGRGGRGARCPWARGGRGSSRTGRRGRGAARVRKGCPPTPAVVSRPRCRGSAPRRRWRGRPVRRACRGRRPGRCGRP